MCFVDDRYLDVPCRSKSGCGPTNDQAVDSPQNVLNSNAFPDNVVTNVSPNIVQQIVQHVHSNHNDEVPVLTTRWLSLKQFAVKALNGILKFGLLAWI